MTAIRVPRRLTDLRDVDGASLAEGEVLRWIDDELVGDNTSVKRVIEHGADGAILRPEGYDSVEWIGSAEPENAIENDTWTQIP